MIKDRWKLAKGVTSSLATAIFGALLSLAQMFVGLHPLEALGFLGCTTFGAFLVLLPIFAMLRAKTRLSLGRCYVVLLVAGAVAGYLLKLIMWKAFEGAGHPSNLLELGATLGTMLALIWVACHAAMSLRD